MTTNPNPSIPSRRAVLAAVVALVAAAGVAPAAPPAAGEVFGHQVLPILRAKCLKCHGDAGKTRGGLDLSSLAAVLKGGDDGPAVVPGKSRESLLWRQISDGEMPPEGQGDGVTYEELQTLAKWIDGSTFPDVKSAAVATTTAVHDRAKALWSFQPLRRPAVPGTPPANPIDAFIGRKLAAAGRDFSPEADRRALVRRVTFDLHGLPPTPDEVEAFVADDGPEAWKNLTERLLASPRYGERWGRHWLDVAGWSESAGSVSDSVRPGYWRYRDWVIRAFNDDKPYDQFVREQLAGDELTDWRTADTFDPDTVDKLTATGFLRCPPDSTDNQPITQDEKVFAAQQTAVEVAAKALLGLTLNCVRCHDHKYDPITQEEYYGLIAVFQPAYDPGKWVAGAVNKYGAGPARVIALTDRVGRAEFDRRFADMKVKSTELSYRRNTGLAVEFRDRHLKAHGGDLPADLDRAAVEAALALAPADRAPPQSELLEAVGQRMKLDPGRLTELYPEMRKRLDECAAQKNQINKQGEQVGDVLWALWDVSTDPTPTRLLVRGDYATPGREVPPGVLTALDRPDAPWRPPAPDLARGTTGRRRAFADWVTRPDHPLTARVMANRVWQYHFGTGLVATPDDFGARGAKPTHPELLDYLATEFVASGWSVKHLHRLILASATYRQAAALGGEADYSAFPRRRLEAEAVRDAMLHVGGLLDVSMGGPSVRTARQDDGSFDVPADEPGRFRRSVYLTTRRSQTPTFLALFDAPQMDTNWPKRQDSAIAPQALALMNHPFVLDCAGAFAGRVVSAAPTTAARTALAYALAYGRPPSAAEAALAADALARLLERGATDLAAWRAVAHALLASNEFLYVD